MNTDNYTSAGYNLPDKILLVTRVVQTVNGTLETPTPEMVRDTILRYQLVQVALETGGEIESDYELCEPIDSSEYRVQLFGDVKVRLGDLGTFPAKINMFNETTRPEDTVELVRAMMRGIWGAGLLPAKKSPDEIRMEDEARKYWNNQYALANTPEDFAQRGGMVDLAQLFPRNEPSASRTAQNAESTGELPTIGIFDYAKLEQYQQQYSGQKVQVEIGKIVNHWQAKKDGSSPYQCIDFYPWYADEKVSQYPVNALRKFPVGADHPAYNYAENKILRELLPEAGNEVMGDIVITYKVTPAKDGSRYFWNILAIDGAVVTDSPTDEDYNDMAGAEIPF